MKQLIRAFSGALILTGIMVLALLAAAPRKAHMFDRPVEFSIGESVRFGELELTLFSIDDSRCKPEVQCIWAGELAANFTVTLGGQSLSRTLRLGTQTQDIDTVGEYTIRRHEITEQTARISVSRMR